MAGRYGMSFAAKLMQEGKYAEAVAEATRAVARDDEDPAPLVDRANAHAWLEQYGDAVRDFEAALALDQTAGVLEVDLVDDVYFSAVLGAARAEARDLAAGGAGDAGALRGPCFPKDATWLTPPPGPTGYAAAPPTDL